jgi:hypothetical protein
MPKHFLGNLGGNILDLILGPGPGAVKAVFVSGANPDIFYEHDFLLRIPPAFMPRGIPIYPI